MEDDAANHGLEGECGIQGQRSDEAPCRSMLIIPALFDSPTFRALHCDLDASLGMALQQTPKPSCDCSGADPRFVIHRLPF
jgi:hypothetical protein